MTITIFYTKKYIFNSLSTITLLKTLNTLFNKVVNNKE